MQNNEEEAASVFSERENTAEKPLEMLMSFKEARTSVIASK